MENLHQRARYLILHRRIGALRHGTHHRPVILHQQLLKGRIRLGRVRVLGVCVELKKLGAHEALLAVEISNTSAVILLQ